MPVQSWSFHFVFSTAARLIQLKKEFIGTIFVFPSILIQLENGPNEFIFIFVSSSDPNLLRKKSVNNKYKKNYGLISERAW